MGSRRVLSFFKIFLGTAALFLIPLTVSYIAVEFTEKIFIFKKRSEVQITASEIVDNIHSRTIYSRSMGAANILGILNSYVKSIVLGDLPNDHPLIMDLQEVLLKESNAEAVYLLNKQGIVVSYSDISPITLTGQNFSFRPYFIQAMKGKHNIFAAQGISSKTRGLYIATPVYADRRSDSQIIGVMVVKDSINNLEDFIRKYEDPVFMVSPQGVIFASNKPEYLYKVAGSLNQEKKKVLASLRRFGAAFDKDAEELGAILDGKDITLDGEKYLVKTHPIDWNDLEGTWNIAYLVKMENILPSVVRHSVFWVVFSVLFIVQGMIYVAVGNRKKRMEVEEQNRKIFKAVEQSPASIIITDSGGVIEYVNPKFTELTEYTFEEVRGSKPSILKSGNTEDNIYKTLWDTILSGREWHGEFLNKKKSGEKYWESVVISPVKNHAGEITNFVGIKEDITDKKRVMKELEAARLTAESATEAKSMFLANMSHEIRTPLNAIIGLSDLALKTDLNPKQTDYIKKVKNAGTSLLAIVNDILDFSKVEAGKIELENIEFELDSVLENIVTAVFQKAEEKGLEFLLHVGSDVPPVIKGDPLRLGQVLINLVNNAVKFTEDGEVELSVKLIREFDNKAEISFSVRDTGVGLMEEQRNRLFTAFAQADGSTTRKYGGTGLGLSISKKLTELMGGSIRVDSEYGKGSLFSFSALFEIGSRAVPWMRYGHEDLKEVKVLVVDDNSSARQIIREILENLDFTPVEAESAEEAIELIKKHDQSDPYKVILMDWKMPGMNGLEAAGIIRSDLGIKNKPYTVMVTAFGRELDRKTIESHGADGFINKPVTASSLIDGISSVIFKSGYEKEKKAAESAENFRGVSVLVVDDNEINRQIAAELLEDTGASVFQASNGREAVNFLKSDERCDIVFMDLQMPDMDGYEAVKIIRADQRFAELPVIAMTAHALDEERRKTRDAGMDGHITKPIIPAELYGCLKSFCVTGEFGGICSVSAGSARKEPDIPPVEGIDFKKGLRTVAGKTELYMRMLEKFAVSSAETDKKLTAELERGDLKTAEMTAHTVKGLAGNIGADRLYEIAGRLERLIADNGEFSAAAEEFTGEMRRLLTALNEALKSSAPVKQPEPVPAVSREDFERIMEKMCSLLEDDDSETVDYFMSIREQASAFFTEQEFKRLHKAVNSYEFEEALRILRSEHG
ncbi:response regulator [Geovibrio thiophilus]|uniref:Sensory/regulatory protein RpfC n=1 Tax=Geovibrio thiophilus TaxID=139438 RepID=A0A3R5V1K2_9BACT|nr:response regulator [Geovibrio thiophilus]QAR33400.1 response regulator [Geovibrio thiophilus]